MAGKKIGTAALGAIAGLCLMSSIRAYAAAPVPTPVLGLAMRDPRCTIEAARLDEAHEQWASEVRGLDALTAVTQKFDKLMDSRKRKPKVPIGEQMTPKEANEFGNLQEQIKIGALRMMLDSKRRRDIRVFGRLAETAKRMQSNFQIPQDTKSDAFLTVGFIVIGREKFQHSYKDEVDAMVISQGTCTLQNALIAEAERVLSSINSIPGLHNAGVDMRGLEEKYGVPTDRVKLDDTERLLYDRTTAVMETAINRQNYFKDFLFISRLEAVSKLQRDTRRQSQYEAPGDNAHINVVWNAWVKEGTITKDQDQLSRVLNYIDAKFPTDFMKSLPDKKAIK